MGEEVFSSVSPCSLVGRVIKPCSSDVLLLVLVGQTDMNNTSTLVSTVWLEIDGSDIDMGRDNSWPLF